MGFVPTEMKVPPSFSGITDIIALHYRKPIKRTPESEFSLFDVLLMLDNQFSFTFSNAKDT